MRLETDVSPKKKKIQIDRSIDLYCLKLKR